MAKKKRRVMTATPQALVKAQQKVIFDAYARGETVEQIAANMNLARGHVTRAINIAMSDLIKQFAMPTPEQNFVRYAAFQYGVLRKLQDCLERFLADPDATQYNSAVSALRAQSDIYDKIIGKGEDYGVIQKKKAGAAIRKDATGMRTELRSRIRTLTVLLEEIDEHTEFRSKRRALKRAQLTERAVQTDIVYFARIRKVQRGPRGVILAVPDWKYRQRVFNSDGTQKRKADYTPEDYARIASSLSDERSPDSPPLLSHLAAELHKERSRESQPIATHHTEDGTIEVLSPPKKRRRRHTTPQDEEQPHTTQDTEPTYLVQPTPPT